MRRIVGSCLDFFTLKTKPLALWMHSIYLKFGEQKCRALSSAFVEGIARFLNSSALYRKKVLDSNLFEKFRFLSLLAVAILAFCFAWNSSLNVPTIVTLSAIVMWFIYQGYRAAYVVACILFALFALIDIFYDGFSALLFLFGWGLLTIVCFWAFNAEMIRVNLEKSFQLKKIPYNLHKDFVVAFLIALACLGISLLGNSVYSTKTYDISHNTPVQNMMKNPKLSLAAGTVARHLYGYQDYCSKQGYNLVIYPKAFLSKFSNSISKIQTDLKQYGYNLETFYALAKSQLGRKLDDSIAVDIENIRRQAIVELVAVKQNTASQNVKWNEELSQLISTSEACAIFDEMAETILLKPNSAFQRITSY